MLIMWIMLIVCYHNFVTRSYELEIVYFYFELCKHKLKGLSP